MQPDSSQIRCPACLSEPGEPCFSTTADFARAEPHRLRVLAALKNLQPCPTCDRAGWVPTTPG